MPRNESLTDVCTALNIICNAEYGAAKGPHPNWAGKGLKPQAPPQNWRVVLRIGRRKYTTDFYGGGAVSTPDAVTVLGCLLDDATMVKDARSFEEWATDLGYDPDSRTAERTYRQIERTIPRLRRFLGEDFARCVSAER